MEIERENHPHKWLKSRFELFNDNVFGLFVYFDSLNNIIIAFCACIIKSPQTLKNFLQFFRFLYEFDFVYFSFHESMNTTSPANECNQYQFNRNRSNSSVFCCIASILHRNEKPVNEHLSFNIRTFSKLEMH